MSQYTIPVSQLAEDLKMTQVYVPDDYAGRVVSNPAPNRPGLQLVGFYSHFDNTRLQLIGIVETKYLKMLPSDERQKCFTELCKRGVPALIITNGMDVFPECEMSARQYKVPLLRTERDTSQFAAELIIRLNTYLAPRMTRHGVLVEVYGEGVLLLGDSGVGKSETAIELVKRGHILIADDAVEIKRVSDTRLIGSAPELIKHYIELRGIGVIDALHLFGVGSVSDSVQIDLVMQLDLWHEGAVYDRLGADAYYTDLLGVKVPLQSIPVAPGRNLAIIVEVAAMNNKQKKMGYNAAALLADNIDKRYYK